MALSGGTLDLSTLGIPVDKVQKHRRTVEAGSDAGEEEGEGDEGETKESALKSGAIKHEGMFDATEHARPSSPPVLSRDENGRLGRYLVPTEFKFDAPDGSETLQGSSTSLTPVTSKDTKKHLKKKRKSPDAKSDSKEGGEEDAEDTNMKMEEIPTSKESPAGKLSELWPAPPTPKGAADLQSPRQVAQHCLTTITITITIIMIWITITITITIIITT
jgi:hypothetical protein